MTSGSVRFFERHSRTIEGALAAFSLALFVWGVADLLNVLPGEHMFRPRQFVVLTGAMALQPLAMLTRNRPAAVRFTLLGLSMVALVAALLIGG